MCSTIEQLFALLLLTLNFNNNVQCTSAYNQHLLPYQQPYSYHQRKGLSLLYEWKQLDWEFASEQERQLAIKNGDFVPGVPFPIEANVFYSDSGSRVFLSVPRFNEGIPAAFNTITPNNTLRPYPPDWSWHLNPHQCRENRIVAVFRTVIDECNRMWFTDMGVINEAIACPPQILAFDLNTDQLVVRYEIPKELYADCDIVSFFITTVVDVRDPHNGCQDTFVYVGDERRFALIVFDVKNQQAWRVRDNKFYPDPNRGLFDIAGEQLDLLNGGLFGMALSPLVPGRDRTLFFHTLSSVTENRIATSAIRNRTRFENTPNAASREFFTYPNTRPSQATAIAIDSNGIEYFVLTTELALVCWNTHGDYSSENMDILEVNRDTLQFASGVKVVRNKNGEEELWVTTIRWHKIALGTLNQNEVNFRVQAAKIDDLIRGTKCDTQKRNLNPFLPYQHHNQNLFNTAPNWQLIVNY